MELDVEGNEQDAMAMADMFEAIDTCPVPVIARVHGSALGGGMGLCAVSDLVIAESGTRFGFTETRLGILPAVISPFVIAKIGESHARALFPGGRRFDAIRAQRIGLVHEVVEGEAGAGRRRRGGGPRRARRRPDRGPGGESDRSRGAGPRPRLVEVAHGACDRPSADERRGPGGLPSLRREARAKLGTRGGRELGGRGVPALERAPAVPVDARAPRSRTAGSLDHRRDPARRWQSSSCCTSPASRTGPCCWPSRSSPSSSSASSIRTAGGSGWRWPRLRGASASGGSGERSRSMRCPPRRGSTAHPDAPPSARASVMATVGPARGGARPRQVGLRRDAPGRGEPGAPADPVRGRSAWTIVRSRHGLGSPRCVPLNWGTYPRTNVVPSGSPLAWSLAWLRISAGAPWRTDFAHAIRDLGPFQVPLRYRVFHAIQQFALPIAYVLRAADRVGARPGRRPAARLICDNRAIDGGGTESKAGGGAPWRHDEVGPAVDRDGSAARSTRWRPLACRI